MKTLEEQITELTEKHEKQVALADRANLIAKAQGWSVKRSHLHSCYTDTVIQLEADDFSEALLMAERSNPASAWLVKDGSTSITPHDSGKGDLITPYWLKAEHSFSPRDCGTTNVLSFYVDGGKDIGLYTVEITLKRVAVRLTQHLRYNNHGDITQNKSGFVIDDPIVSDHLNRSLCWWSSPEVPNARTFYAL
tara:strand:- start:794 stop:1372 length:579 start_codon:yes stop_codon:yes gene_type:complete